MKLPSSNPFLSQITALAALVATPLVHATDGTWLGNVNWWSDPASWASSQIASGIDGTANFTGVNIGGNIDKPLGGAGDNRTIGNITFTDTTPSHNLTISGNTLTLDVTTGSPQINVTNQTLTISSIVAGSDGLTKIGGGGLTLSNNNSYTGVTAINVGTIAISHANALGSTAVGSHTTIAAFGNTTGGGVLSLSNNINSAENITITGATEQNIYSSAILSTGGTNTLSGNITLASPTGGIRLGTSGSSGSLTFSGNISQTGTSQGLAFSVNGGTTITVNNAIALNNGTLQVYSTGSLTLKGVNGVGGIGNTVVSQSGTLKLGVAEALKTTGSLDIGVGTVLTTDAGTFDLAGFNQTVNALSGIGTAATNSNRKVINSVVGTKTLTVGNGGGSGTFNGVILTGTGQVELVKTGIGNQTLNATNTSTGGTRIDNGTLTLGHATDTLANGGAVNVNGGTLALGTNTDTVGAVTLTSGSITGSGTALQGVLTGTGSAYDVRSGTISAKLGGTVGLTKSTGGTVTLTGVNTYNGATNINAGTLTVNDAGSINNSAVTVNGGTFRYNSSVAYSGTLTYTSGTIGGTNLTGSLGGQVIGANRTLSPGNSPGTANTTSQTWDDGGSYVWEINNTAGTAGGLVGWDLENGTGTLDITSTIGTPFNIYVTSLGLDNLAGALTNFNNATSYNWMIADFLSVTGFASNLFNIDTANFTNKNTINGTFAVALGNTGGIGGDSSQIYLTYTAVPEPNVAALLGGLGMLTLLRRRRN